MAIGPTFLSGYGGLNTVLVNAANTARDGTGTLAVAYTAGGNGSRISEIHINAIGTTTQGVIRIFMHNGTAAFLFKEILVTAVAPSTTVPVWSTVLTFSNPINLPPLWSIRVSTHNAESFHVTVVGGNY